MSDENLMYNPLPDWEALRKLFPVADNYVYFNHAAIAPVSVKVRNSIAECVERFTTHGIVCNRDYLEEAEETRKLAAKLINSDSREITFIKNTTQGIQIAANGIRWNKGDNVVIPGNEFPANVFPWLNLRERGVEVRFIPVSEGRFNIKDIAKEINNRTKAISVSAVSYTNGFRCDLSAIGEFCRANGIFFIVDAIQALGAIALDVKKSRIDLLSADAHKWMLGPQGIGIAYISNSFLEKLEVSNLGYKSMSDESDYLNYNIRLKPDASRFEEGTLNIFGIAGLKAAIELLLSVGITTIENRILEITGSLMRNLLAKGFILNSPMNEGERSGIVSLRHESIQADVIYDKLFKAGIVCAKRGGAIRISPHFYNNQNDIDHFLNALQ